MSENAIYSGSKYNRILQIYTRLQNGEVIDKNKEAERFGVHYRSIQRDIDALKKFFDQLSADGYAERKLLYSREKGGYFLKSCDPVPLSRDETLAACLTLIQSRAFTKDELLSIVGKLINALPDIQNRRLLKSLVADDLSRGYEKSGGRSILGMIFTLSSAAHERTCLNVTLCDDEGEPFCKRIKPLWITLRDSYFYLIGLPDNGGVATLDTPPEVCRVDKIVDIELLGETFAPPFRDKEQEEEYRLEVRDKM